MENVNEAVSIIEFVDDLAYAKSVFQSYMLQNIRKKELILVYTGASDDFEKWLFLTRLYPMTRIYQLNNGSSLGECLNYCTERSIFENIAIFGEANTYEYDYLSSTLRDMQTNKVQLAGKKTYYMRNKEDESDIKVNQGFESCVTDFVILHTFVLRHTLFDIFRFNNGDNDVDTDYCARCRSGGFNIYSTAAEGFRLCK